MKRDVFYLVSKWDHNLVFNSRHLLIHLNLVSTLSQLLIVSPAKISGFISWEIRQAHGYNLLPWSLVDEASSTRDLGRRLGWVLAKSKNERRRYPAISTEQPWSLKDLFNGQKGIFFFLRDHSKESRENPERTRWPQFGRSGSQSEHRIRFSINWVQALRIGYVDVTWETGSMLCRTAPWDGLVGRNFAWRLFLIESFRSEFTASL